MSKKCFYTIGVYGSTEEEFFNKLVKIKATVFVDIRMRRGMRGAKYSFVNSKYLQNRLSELRIEYLYLKELAPTKEMRMLQKNDDILKNVIKTTRKSLSDTYTKMYLDQILVNIDLCNLKSILYQETVVFFCVEAAARSCHRSIVSDFLLENTDMGVIHL